MNTDLLSPIGIYDSGTGAIGFAAKLHRLLPQEDLVVLTDTDHCPLGEKPEAEIQSLVSEGIATLASLGARSVVLACNTASTVLPFLRFQHDLPIQGLLLPGAKAAVAALTHRSSRCGHVAILCTPATLASGQYPRLIEMEARSRGVPVSSEVLACPELASSIQNVSPQMLTGPSIRQACQYHIGQLVRQPDVLLLGCSHYELVAQVFSQLMPPTVGIVCPGDALATAMWASLVSCRQAVHQRKRGTVSFVGSKTGCKSEAMENLLGVLLGASI